MLLLKKIINPLLLFGFLCISVASCKKDSPAGPIEEDPSVLLAAQMKEMISNKKFAVITSPATSVGSAIVETWNYFWLCENGIFETMEVTETSIIGDDITKTKYYYGEWDVKSVDGSVWFYWKDKHGGEQTRSISIENGTIYIHSDNIVPSDLSQDEYDYINEEYLKY